MKILAIGDIFGRPGRQALAHILPSLIREYKTDFVIANAENASGGKGLNPKSADEIFLSSINVLTAGNHIWELDTIHPYFDSHPILRPYNVESGLPGKGYGIFAAASGARVAVVCLQGMVFMDDKGRKATNPLEAMDLLLPEIENRADVIIVDFHAETTSEKKILAWYLDGRVGAVVGTHTHVQTADEQILPQGTAYISDLGMTGPHESVIGLDKDIAIHRYRTGDKKKFKVAKGGVRVEGVVVEIDEKTGKAKSIVRIKKSWSDPLPVV